MSDLITVEILVGSTEYLQYRLDSVSDDPSAIPISFAFLPQDSDPDTVVWYDGEWYEDESASSWNARILLGPTGTVELETGMYEVRLQYTDDPEMPIQTLSRLYIRE